MNLAIFLPNWVGDLVMATPTLRAVRRHFGPSARIVGILRPQLAAVLDGSPWLDDQIAFDHHGGQREHGRLALIGHMRRQRFDMALLLTNSLHTAVLAWLGGARQRVGYARDGRSLFLTQAVAAAREGRRFRPSPMVESYLALARAIGCPDESPRLELNVTAAETRQAQGVWRDLGLRTDGRVVALNSTGAFGAAKLWPDEHCAALARQIVEQLDHDVLVFCGPGERGCPSNRRAGRFAAGLFPGRPGRRPGTDQGLPGALPADGFHRQRAATRRGRPGQNGDYAAGPHVAGLDREPQRPRRDTPHGDRLPGLRQADLPAGASPLHARPQAGTSVGRGGGGLANDDDRDNPGRSGVTERIAIVDRYRKTLERTGLAAFDDVMGSTWGQCLRVLPDRENWYLQGCNQEGETCGASASECAGPRALGMYLKKHRGRTWATRIAAALDTAAPPSPGRVEADRALALQSLGIDVMPLMAYGEKLHADGRLESFLLSEELQGYCELQEFIERRFPPRKARSASHALRRLVVQVAGIARRFHAAGFNHRDFYCCHFLVKETSPGRFDVRLIDLQRVQRRRWFRRRWIVKDLAQLASMSPDDQVGCREKVLFLRTYLGVKKLRSCDKRLVREVFWKLSSIRRRARRKS